MIPRTELQARVGEWGLTEEVIEKDYVLGWLLAGIGAHPVLGETWVFKGGTCLKKCYIETYRFSEDLDFTVVDDGPLGPDDLLPVLGELLDQLEHDSGIEFTSREPVVKLRSDPRSAEGRIYYRGPRGAPTEARVKLDLTARELLVRPSVARTIAHDYDEQLPGPAAVRCYAFEEVFAEKLRALGDRARPRDLYDVVNLYRHAELRDRRATVADILMKKCAFKELPAPTLETVTAPDKLADLRADWGQMLGHQLPVLPPIDDYLESLGELFDWLGGAEPAALEPAPHLEEVEPGWAPPPTITRWPGGAPLEQIRFAGNNHLLVELGYQNSQRLIEPYSLRRSKAGNLLVYAVKHATGEIRAYRVDRIQSVRVTDRTFRPRYAIELSTVLPVQTGRRGSRTGRHRPRSRRRRGL